MHSPSYNLLLVWKSTNYLFVIPNLDILFWVKKSYVIIIICNPQFTCFPSSKEVPSVEILLLCVLVSYTELCLVGFLAPPAGSVLVSNSWVLCGTNAVLSGLSDCQPCYLIYCCNFFLLLKHLKLIPKLSQSIYCLWGPILCQSNQTSGLWDITFMPFDCWCLLGSNLFLIVFIISDQLNVIK